jgi:hypothetical protein
MWNTVRTFLSGVVVASVLAVVSLLISPACAGSTKSPTSPASACQTNNTATVTFENRSASGLTYSVVWDGSTWTTLAPSVKSAEYTVAAGVQHTLTFKIANSNELACSTSTPTLAQCSSANYWCTK